MPKVEWLADRSRVYETGVDRGMLYVNGGTGVAWNGLVKVSETSTGGSVREFFLDGDKYLNLPSLEEYSATIEAISSPKEFAPCEGRLQFYPGAYATNQPRQQFAFSYRTLIGNEVDGLTEDYKLHIVYNVTAKRADITHQTITQTPNLKTYSWAINAVPEPFIDYKPGSHFVIDTRVADPDVVTAIEDMLYGTDTTDPTLPTVPQLMNILVQTYIDVHMAMKKMQIAGSVRIFAGAAANVRMKKMRITAAVKGITRATGSTKMKKMRIAAGISGITRATGGAKMKKMRIASSVVIPFVKGNSLEGGVNATALTTANSGGLSGDSFDQVSQGSGATLNYESAQKAHGGLSLAIATTATSALAEAGWTLPPGGVRQAWFRFYIYQTAAPSGNIRVFGCYQTGVSGTRFFIRSTTAQKFAFVDSAGGVSWTSSASYPLNQWVRVEGMAIGDASTGQFWIAFYSGDSTTPIEQFTSAANENLAGELGTMIWGVSAASSNVAKQWYDDMAVSTLGPIGPWTVGTPIMTASISMKKMRIAGTSAEKAIFAGGARMKKMVIAAGIKGIARATGGARMKKMTIAGTGTVSAAGVSTANANVRMKKMRVAGTSAEKTIATGGARMKKMRIAGTSAEKTIFTGGARMKKMTVAAAGSVLAPFARGNTLEGGTNTTVISTGNSGAASGDAFDYASAGSGATLAFETAQKMHGALAMAVATGGTAAVAYAGWNVTATKFWGRFYIYRTVTETANTRVAAAYGTSPASAPRGFIRIATGGKLVACDAASAILWTSATALPINQWIRVEFMMNCDPTVGQFTLSYYNTAEGITATESFTSTATQNMGGAPADFLFGVPIAQASVPKMWYDDMAISTVGALGPSGAGPIGMLTDTFPGTTLDATKWTSFGTVSVASGRVSLTSPAGSTGSAGIQGFGWYDLTSGEASVQLVSAGTQIANTEALLSLQAPDNNNRAQIFCQNGSLVAQHQANGTWSAWLASVTYSAATHKYIRLRESAGTLYYEYSTDGYAWTALYSEANPFPVTRLQPTIQQYNLATDAAATSQWDNFNVIFVTASTKMKKMRIAAAGTVTAAPGSIATGGASMKKMKSSGLIVAGSPFKCGGTMISTGSTSRVTPVTAATEAGDTLIIVLGSSATACTVTSVSDSKGNIYTADKAFNTAIPVAAVFRSPGPTGGPGGTPTVALTTSDTITAIVASTTGLLTTHVTDLPGTLVDVLDVLPAAFSTANSASPAAAVTPTQNYDASLAVFVTPNAGGSPTVAAPYTLVGTPVTGTSAPYASAAYQLLGAGTSGVAQTATETIISGNWRGINYAFKRRTS